MTMSVLLIRRQRNGTLSSLDAPSPEQRCEQCQREQHEEDNGGNEHRHGVVRSECYGEQSETCTKCPDEIRAEDDNEQADGVGADEREDGFPLPGGFAEFQGVPGVTFGIGLSA